MHESSDNLPMISQNLPICSSIAWRHALANVSRLQPGPVEIDGVQGKAGTEGQAKTLNFSRHLILLGLPLVAVSWVGQAETLTFSRHGQKRGAYYTLRKKEDIYKTFKTLLMGGWKSDIYRTFPGETAHKWLKGLMSLKSRHLNIRS